ncbi:MAG: DEAD/DEAH box helicase family protein, partial [Candidatus Lokiarchaeota archaeon]|nr:DEAD/DEAH box helicase family protein [Candidatus Lokiarchaeota archaeon]
MASVSASRGVKMTRILVENQLQKRRDIRAMKAAQPELSCRALAKSLHTSFRVVSDALTSDASELVPTNRPAIACPVPTKEALAPRPYQASAARASIGRNTLLVLPTGLGKTIVALLHVQAILSSAPAGISLMMAPTKALLVQHRDLFQRHLAIPGAALAIVDGETTPDNRRTFYQSLAGKRVVLFMTPQTVQHDLEKGRLPREAIIDLVVDEAHHATRGDPYALVYTYLREHHIQPRVLAMTASPGETEQRIIDVCQNLGINP